MKKETLKEVGKASLNLGNIIGGLSIVNGLFGVNQNLPQSLITIIVVISFIFSYMAGILLLEKGEKDD